MPDAAAPVAPPTPPEDDTPKAIREWMASAEFVSELEVVLPKHIRPERFAITCVNALRRDVNLYKCTRGSLRAKILELGRFGLEPDGQRAWLTCWKDDRDRYWCEYIIGYKGYLELLWRTGVVNTVHADWVGANEAKENRFSFEYGQNEHLIHKPLIADRGDAVAFYCYITFKDRGPKFEVMAIGEVNQTRDLSYGYRKAKREGKDHPWITHPGEMGKKTVFLRATKWLELSAELRAALDSDYDSLPEAAVEERRAKERGEPDKPKGMGVFSGAVTTNAAADTATKGAEGEKTPAADKQTSTSTPPPPEKTVPPPEQSAPPPEKKAPPPEKAPAPPPREKPFVMPPMNDPNAASLLRAELVLRLHEINAQEPMFVAWSVAANLAGTACKAVADIDPQDLRMVLGSWAQVAIAFAADTGAAVTLPPPPPKPKAPPITSPVRVASVPRPSRRKTVAAAAAPETDPNSI